LDRLQRGTVLGAEGYLFELERRGYIKAGAYVPEGKLCTLLTCMYAYFSCPG
jgi:hypothetical protein